MVCKMSNFDKLTAKHLAQACCTELTLSDLKLDKKSDQNVSMCTEVRICVTVRENRFYLNRHTHTHTL